ncbi:MAG: hypothetical protein ACHQ50_06735 [Fimbriimonadales bacterium]
MEPVEKAKVPFLVRPRVLVVMSWLIATGMACDALWPKVGPRTIFMPVSAMVGIFILTLWSWKETRPVRTKQWWALLFFANYWGIEFAFWLRYYDRLDNGRLVLVTWATIAIFHLLLSALVWRDHLIPSSDAQPVTHS